ncbi:MAG: outer membrane beta-barrel family protein, partial [Bacteroidota bacterium]
RIRRPRFWDLNPFFTFSDNRNFFSGNPDLDPEFSHSIELGYLRYFTRGSLSSSIYFRRTEGVIQRIRLVDDRGNSVTRPENLATEDAYGLEVTAAYEFTKWWRFNTDLNLYGFEIDGSNVDATFGAQDFTWFARGTSRFNLNKRTTAQIRFNYRAPRASAQGTRRSMNSIDIAANHDFLAEKATITFSVRDVFNARRRRFTSFGDNFFSEGDFQWRPRSFVITINYRLNQEKKRGGNRGRNGYGGDGDF